MWQRFGDEVEFLVVYVREAHAIDSFVPKGGGEDPILLDPISYAQRREVATECVGKLALAPMTAVVDTLDDATSRAYDAWPDRLYLVGRDGRVAYQGGRGPELFFPEELEEAIEAELAGVPEAPSGLRDEAVSRSTEFVEADPLDDQHSILYRWWEIESQHFRVLSTADRVVAESALLAMESTLGDLDRLFGVRPERKPTVILLRNLEQYNAFGITPPGGLRVPPGESGHSGFHHAFLCERWVDLSDGRDYPGAAAALWDQSSETGAQWGPFAARHAAAHTFLEQLDPSRQAVDRMLADPYASLDTEAFYAEKAIPLWLRYGAASYVERFFVDDSADPFWARRWSMDALRQSGELESIETILRCELHFTEVERSQFRLLEVGALVAFLLDGGVERVEAAHQQLRRALRDNRDVAAAVRGLEATLIDSESEFRAFVESR